jgi:CARDB
MHHRRSRPAISGLRYCSIQVQIALEIRGEVSTATVNLGNSAAPPTVNSFALSPDDVPGDDIPLRGSRPLSELAAGTTSTGLTRVAVDIGTPLGLYFLVVCADSTGAVAELSETNNCRTSVEQLAVTAAQPATSVRLHLLGRRGWADPGAGVPVLVHGPDGELVARVATDETATAVANVPVGGSVTVVEVGPRYLTTFDGLKSGDDLTVGDLWRATDPIGTATVLLPVDPSPDGYYSVEGPCAVGASDSPAVQVFLHDGCGSPTRPMIAVIGSPDGSWHTSIFDPQVALEPGGTAALSGNLEPMASLAVALSGLPADVPWVDLTVGGLLGSRVVYRWFAPSQFRSSPAR